MRIETIKIEHFKGIKELKVSNLSLVNVFIGKNNSSKTTFLEAVGSFFSSQFFGSKITPPPTLPHHNKKGEQFNNAKIGITFRLPSDFYTQGKNPHIRNFDENQINIMKTSIGDTITVNKVRFNEPGGDMNNLRAIYLMDFINPPPNDLKPGFEEAILHSLQGYYQGQNSIKFITAIDGYKINYEMQAYYQQVYGDGSNQNQPLRGDARGIFSQLFNLQNSDSRYKADSFIERLKKFKKDFPRFHVRNSGNAVIELGEREHLKSIPFYSQGNGQIESVVLFWLFDDLSSEGQPKCRIYLMDEPENHKHPALQREVLKRITKTAEETGAQFFIATHSPVFASQYRNPNVRVYAISKDEESDTNTAKLVINPAVAQEAKTEIGLLNIDSFFQDFVLFVEGDMEAVIVPALLRFFGTDEESLAIKIRNVQSNDNVSLSRLKETLEIVKDTGITPLVVLDNENNAPQNRDDIKKSYASIFKDEIQYKLWTTNLINSLPEKIVLDAFNKMLADKGKPLIDQAQLNVIKGSNLEKGLEKYYYDTTQGSLKPGFANFIAQEILSIPAADKPLYETTEVFDHINKIVVFVNQVDKKHVEIPTENTRIA